tara:strand:- start:51579 stop:51899 length:321 start_codon:yes stop_codon:yes gene_type:complete
MTLKLYKISQELVGGWDTYDSAVVAAYSLEDARNINACSFVTHAANGKWMGTYSFHAISNAGEEYEKDDGRDWPRYCDIKHVKVDYLGTACSLMKRGVILASFNAG